MNFCSFQSLLLRKLKLIFKNGWQIKIDFIIYKHSMNFNHNYYKYGKVKLIQ